MQDSLQAWSRDAKDVKKEILMMCRAMDPETDPASQKVGGRLPRYWAPQQARLERDRGLRRVRLGHAAGVQADPIPTAGRLCLPLPAFIPLQELNTQVC